MLFRLRGSLTTFTIGRWRSLLHVLCMFAPIKWKACGTLQGNPLDFATKRLVQAFSEVSASGLSTSASTHLGLVFVCHQWLGGADSPMQLSYKSQNRSSHCIPCFRQCLEEWQLPRRRFRQCPLESIQRSSKWGYMKRLELNELPPTWKTQLISTRDASTVTRLPKSNLDMQNQPAGSGQRSCQGNQAPRAKNATPWHSPSLQKPLRHLKISPSHFLKIFRSNPQRQLCKLRIKTLGLLDYSRSWVFYAHLTSSRKLRSSPTPCNCASIIHCITPCWSAMASWQVSNHLTSPTTWPYDHPPKVIDS